MFRQLVRSATFTYKNRFNLYSVRVCAISLSPMSVNHSNFARLPRTVKPINYKLDFVPDFSKFVFTGNATVELHIVEPTNQIIFNSKGLSISSASYDDSPANIILDEEHEIVKFEFSGGLRPGKGNLTLEFSGQFANDMLGLYRSVYKDENGKEGNILATQFESVYARRAFPCMDEPDRKATFDISIVGLDSQVVLSNMPEISRDILPTPEGCDDPPDGHNYVKVSFDRTPIMSTYLVAMVVGDFEYTSTVLQPTDVINFCSLSTTKEPPINPPGPVEIRVYTQVGKRDFGQYALKVAKNSLPFYTKLFGSPYPLPKLDLIAIPDFACGAMENWGLITYRETALLIDPENSSLLSKQSVALTVAHEISHMWFGNLVTMSWWTDLWLKEGFATWAEYLAVDYCFPDYDIWTLFVSHDYLRALRLDELKSSHPIEVEVSSPHEVEEIFDAVSYQKGSCVIRMLHNYMGPPLFEMGLKSYIEKFKYGNARTNDLWAALEETGLEKLTELMSLWTKQTGYPVVFARLIHAPDGTYSIGVKQRRFLADGSPDKDDASVYWRLPINVCPVDDSETLLLRKVTNPPASTPNHGDKDHVEAEAVAESAEVLYPLPDSALPLVRLKPDAIDFYRVHYDSSLLNAILEAVAKGTVPERDRISLLDDQFALARAGVQDLARVLQFCRAFAGEMKYSVWSVLAQGLAQVRTLLEEASYPAGDEVVFPEVTKELCGLNKLYIELALPVYEKIGFEPNSDDSNNVRLLRPIIISILGRVGHGGVISKARAAFDRHYEAVTSVPTSRATVDQAKLISPDLRTAVYSICMRNGGDAEFQELLELHDRATLNDERVHILSSLGATCNPKIIARLFDLTFTEYVRKQDRFHVLLGVTWSAGGRRALWNLVRSRIATLTEDLATTHLLAHVLKGSAADFASQERYDEIKAFYDENDVPCRRAIQQALESVKINAERWRRDEKTVCEFLNKLAC